MKKIFEIGTSSDFDDYKNQTVVASNKLLSILFLLALLFFLYSVFYADDFILFSSSYFALISASIALNSYKAIDFSRGLFLSGTILFVTIAHSFITHSGTALGEVFYLAQFILIILPCLIIDLRELPLLIGTTLMALAAFIIQPWILEGLNFEQPIIGEGSGFLGSFIFVVLLFIVVWPLYNVKRDVKQDAEKTHRLRRQAEEKDHQMAHRKEELEKRIEEINGTHKIEEQRSWVAHGVSQMIDLMRSKKENLYPELIEEIVRYLGAAVGAIYSLTDEEIEEKQLKLEGCFAYDRRKYLSYSIPFGDGVTGQSCLDREIVYLDKVPKDFLDLTSGLGDEPPKHLAIVPLFEEQEVAGVFEIASNEKFEEHQKEFLRQLSASIASFILTNSVNEKIQVLIEQNQSQAEEMRAQEEEMLQNMEELHATQEEMSRKEKEYIEKIEHLEKKLSIKPEAN